MKSKEINCFTPKLTDRPIVGDIIFGEKEFIIGRRKKSNENIIEVGVTKKQCINEVASYEEIISKGFLFKVPTTIKQDNSIVDKSRSKATWVIESVEYKTEVKLLHSTLPESYFIRARRLEDNKITDLSETIEFYTCGRYENTINKKLEVIGKYTF